MKFSKVPPKMFNPPRSESLLNTTCLTVTNHALLNQSSNVSSYNDVSSRPDVLISSHPYFLLLVVLSSILFNVFVVVYLRIICPSRWVLFQLELVGATAFQVCISVDSVVIDRCIVYVFIYV